ncbi:hypothetical protein [Tellurirhabdus bombi]|uniref:hypothetical protein n=1 Tax=Tellurirhabdus bombi TaxID=2907205 RepID=UPI001F3FED52|nr:hypothetical protein [Tellurirhabdus bombi]
MKHSIIHKSTTQSLWAVGTMLTLSLAGCSSQGAQEASKDKADSTKDAKMVAAASPEEAPATAAASKSDSVTAVFPGADTLQFKGTLPDTILPKHRILAYYGNPHSKRMGILGEYPKDEMLRRLDKEAKNWEKADPSKPVQKALHLVAISAQSAPGKDGKYRLRMTSKTIRKVIKWGSDHGALVFLDIQVGLGNLQDEMEYLRDYLKLPHVHLGIDPEFSMKTGAKPGTKIGTYDAADINGAVRFLSGIAKEYNLPPKILVVHRFTQRMVTNYKNIKLDPKVDIVIDMDGWGPPVLKRDTYRDYIKKEPIQYTGFKLFYHNDVKKPPHKLMTPEEVLTETPQPLYIQYQ